MKTTSLDHCKISQSDRTTTIINQQLIHVGAKNEEQHVCIGWNRSSGNLGEIKSSIIIAHKMVIFCATILLI